MVRVPTVGSFLFVPGLRDPTVEALGASSEEALELAPGVWVSQDSGGFGMQRMRMHVSNAHTFV